MNGKTWLLFGSEGVTTFQNPKVRRLPSVSSPNWVHPAGELTVSAESPTETNAMATSPACALAGI